jgi:formylglycine-generating enzyme required for sulfatase activity
MGSSDQEKGRYGNEGPMHKVCILAFDLGQFEVTQGEWRRVMIFPNPADPSYAKGDDRCRAKRNGSMRRARARRHRAIGATIRMRAARMKISAIRV